MWLNNVRLPALQAAHAPLTKSTMGYCDFEVQHIDLEYYTPNELDIGIQAAPTVGHAAVQTSAAGPCPGGVVRKYCPSLHFRAAWVHDADEQTQDVWSRNATDPTMQVSVLLCTVAFYANLAHSSTRSP